jgi:flagellar biosynthesis/type III secretory pathway chaperone
VSEYKNDIEYQISQITDIQYLVKQINLNNGSIVELLFFKNNVGYLSSSANGIDNIIQGYP